MSYRNRKNTYVVYGPPDDKEAKEKAEQLAKGRENVSVLSTTTFDPWNLVVQTCNVCFVIGDKMDENTDSFFQWVETEKFTRLDVSRSIGWIENIVYTQEGSRRNGFHRVNFKVVGENEAAHNLNVYMECFGAKRVKDVFLNAIESDPNDLPGALTTYEWVFGCPCCVQFNLEKHRRRPSNLRIGTFQMILCALFVERTAIFQLERAIVFYLSQYLPSPLMGEKVGVLPTQSHIPPSSPPIPMFECMWGDEELIEKDDLIKNREEFLSVEHWKVNDTFQLVQGLGITKPDDWEFEYAAYFNGTHLVVKHEHSDVKATYAVAENDLFLFEGLIAGERFPHNFKLKNERTILDDEKLLWWFVNSGLIVPQIATEVDVGELQRMANEFRLNGWTLFKDMRRLIARPYWNALRRYYKILRPWLTINAPGKTWNDEPVARHLNFALTAWMEKICELPCVQSSLTLSIFVQPGQEGFLYHTDTSPPFDATLDFVIDHEGSGTRPLYFCRQNPNGSWYPKVERLDLKVGEAVIFRGAEMTHWGGDLDKESAHSVILLTWQYCQD